MSKKNQLTFSHKVEKIVLGPYVLKYRPEGSRNPYYHQEIEQFNQNLEEQEYQALFFSLYFREGMFDIVYT